MISTGQRTLLFVNHTTYDNIFSCQSSNLASPFLIKPCSHYSIFIAFVKPCAKKTTARSVLAVVGYFINRRSLPKMGWITIPALLEMLYCLAFYPKTSQAVSSLPRLNPSQVLSFCTPFLLFYSTSQRA